MKPWPTDGSTVDFEDLVNPVLKVLRQLYMLERIWDADPVYDGYNVGDLHINLSADEQLSKSHLDWIYEDQGRSAIEVVLAVAVQLGIEQGRRVERKTILSGSVGALARAGLHDEAAKLVIRMLSSQE